MPLEIHSTMWNPHPEPVLPTPGKIIRPGHQKNLSAGRTILPYPAAACMIIVDLCFFTIQTIFWGAVTQMFAITVEGGPRK